VSSSKRLGEGEKTQKREDQQQNEEYERYMTYISGFFSNGALKRETA